MLQRAVQRPSALRFASTTLPLTSHASSILRPLTPVISVPLLRGLSNTASAAVSRKPGRTGGHSATGQAADVRRVGLVSKWHDAYYGLALPNPVAAGELLLTPGLLWAAAVNDAAAANEAPAVYLARVRVHVADFFDSKERDGLPRVINHGSTLAALRGLGEFDGKSKLLLLTGPRSIGKSLMLQKVAKELAGQKRRVLYIDARQYGPDLTKGIIASLVAEPDAFFAKVVKCLPLTVASSVIALAGTVVAPMTAAAVVLATLVTEYSKAKDAPIAAQPQLDAVLGAFFAACKAGGEYPVIVIDEANVAFEAAIGDATAIARVKTELQLFTRITKQQREANIVLATSEHGLPFRLRALGYNTNHISKKVVAEEVPPAFMKDELMRTWGCGEHLATALLSMYGGHVLTASAAVRELATSTDPASMEGIAAVGSVASAPALCLSASNLSAAGVPTTQWDDMRMRVTEVLRSLVTKGFVALDSEEDKVAEVISLADAGSVIPRDGIAAGVPPGAWLARTPSGKAPIHLLVPSSNMMRLLIAREVFPRRA